MQSNLKHKKNKNYTFFFFFFFESNEEFSLGRRISFKQRNRTTCVFLFIWLK